MGKPAEEKKITPKKRHLVKKLILVFKNIR
jgi:hypothetical protein